MDNVELEHRLTRIEEWQAHWDERWDYLEKLVTSVKDNEQLHMKWVLGLLTALLIPVVIWVIQKLLEM